MENGKWKKKENPPTRPRTHAGAGRRLLIWLFFFSFLYILSAARVCPLLLSLTFAERRVPYHPWFDITHSCADIRGSSPETNNGGRGVPLDPRQHSHHHLTTPGSLALMKDAKSLLWWYSGQEQDGVKRKLQLPLPSSANLLLLSRLLTEEYLPYHRSTQTRGRSGRVQMSLVTPAGRTSHHTLVLNVASINICSANGYEVCKENGMLGTKTEWSPTLGECCILVGTIMG
ncbi:hypothetical protein ASPBRDRAFT_515730 [Aspergillus brasiliensis CBS 101740]|uniref:Uncharacterized protein n=1 Tax=Aspergillus brasiliensis (strain CBS 101740 / IMI 381727 / IBT 21946) TaxID=767769 RepID=A0A1L9UPU7_ASPBC|nr:hypothetical protein ASPBRDRAFT_515730 [Aspergillus brasiliensis CBS 101740]